MPNRTIIEITESIEELQQLELRIAMLQLMKQQPEITQKELAAERGAGAGVVIGVVVLRRRS